MRQAHLMQVHKHESRGLYRGARTSIKMTFARAASSMGCATPWRPL